jgi:manganese/zinc/iron transport system permease protein
MTFSSLVHYFTDPVLWAPTIGSMLMCLASSLIGVVAFLRKRCLLAETLSHASYPGIIISVFFLASFVTAGSEIASICVLCGAFLSSLAGLWLVDLMERRLKVKSDAALCFALSLFFGIGILAASRVQILHPLWYNQVHLFLYGQVATMTELHVMIYAVLFTTTLAFLFFLYRPLQLINFDRQFAKTLGVRVRLVDIFLFFLLVLAVVIGMRSVGVVLMSGMLIAPAVAARQFTHKLWLIFVLAGIFGLASGFFGNYFSLEIPKMMKEKISLPTGPMILLCASSICIFSLLFAPKAGLVSRLVRITRFKEQCRLENALKSIWRGKENKQISKFLLCRLRMKGWLKGEELTEEGKKRAVQIVRLHRLWEVYLVSLGQGAEKVHHSAEEMEHIITPALERQLTEFLQDPKHDPHKQPIPESTLGGALG